MLWKLAKIVFLTGVFFSTTAIYIIRFFPSKISLIIIIYMIVISSIVSGSIVYYEFFVKPKKHYIKIKKIIEELKIINKGNFKKLELLTELQTYKQQNWFFLDKGLSKIEEKIEKIEKQIMDMNRC